MSQGAWLLIAAVAAITTIAIILTLTARTIQLLIYNHHLHKLPRITEFEARINSQPLTCAITQITGNQPNPPA